MNVPYDARFQPLYLACIAGLCGVGLTPRTVLEIPAQGKARLQRIIDLIRQCGSSLHDLSRVELDPGRPRSPRFNMPFELGLAVAIAEGKTTRGWFVMEARSHRLLKSLSDLNGFDPLIHGGRPRGVLRAILNAFQRTQRRPTVTDLERVLQDLRRAARRYSIQQRSVDLFTAHAFRTLVVLSQELVRKHKECW